MITGHGKEGKIVREQFTNWDWGLHHEIANDPNYIEYERRNVGNSFVVIAYGYKEYLKGTKYRWIPIAKAIDKMKGKE